MGKQRAAALSFSLALLLLFPTMIMLAPPAFSASLVRQGVLDACDDGSTSKSILFNQAGNRTDCYLPLDNHAKVDNAWVQLTLQGTRSSARTDPFDRTPDAFPQTPWLDVSANGSREWAFNSSMYGPLGHTTAFSDGSTSASVNLGQNGELALAFDVPSRASIINATITLSGDPAPYWAQQYQLTDPNWSQGEEGPFLMAYGGFLWAAWSSKDPAIVTGGNDFDVVVRSYNGTSWSPVTDLSPPPGEDTQDDREVIMVVYNGELWVIWSHGFDDGTSGNTDLMYRRYNGAVWSDIGYISPNPTDGLNTYENAIVHDGKLWVEWHTTDTSISAGLPPPQKDLDIVIRSFNGANDSWDPTVELTAPDNYYLDWISDIASFGGKLYVVWEATYWNLSQSYGFGNTPPASDIAMRVWNGTAWSPIQMMSQEIDNREGVNIEDQSPRLGVYHNPVSGLDELYLIWMRGCLQENGCTPDYDIAYRVFNGAAWTPTDYLTYPNDTDQDMFPCMANFNNVFYVFWVSGVNVTETPANGVTLIAAYGDIVYRAYNGREWSDIKMISQPGLDNVSHPTCAVYNGRLFAAWEKPTNWANGSTEWDISVRNIDFNKVQLTGVYGGVQENYTAPVNLSFYDTAFPFNLTGLNSLLGNNPVGTDAWGNEISRIPLRLSTTNPANVQVTGIDIRYSYTVRVNITQALNDQIQAEKGDLYQFTTLRAPLELGMEGGAGRISIDQIHVEYRIDYPPTLVRSINSIKIDEDSGLAAPFDLNDYFTDDWDAGHLRFAMGNATNTGNVYLALDGPMLTVGTLTPNWCGVATFTITAYDRNAYFATSNNVTVFVACVNDPPVLQPVDDLNLSAAQVYRGDLSAYDPDIGDILTFSSDSPWVTVNPDTGAFLIGDKEGMPDNFAFNVTVTDLAGASDTKNATVTVWRATQPVNYLQENNIVDFPYYLFLLFLGPIVGYGAYRLRAHRLQALDEAREDIQHQQDVADLKEIDEG